MKPETNLEKRLGRYSVAAAAAMASTLAPVNIPEACAVIHYTSCNITLSAGNTRTYLDIDGGGVDCGIVGTSSSAWIASLYYRFLVGITGPFPFAVNAYSLSQPMNFSSFYSFGIFVKNFDNLQFGGQGPLYAAFKLLPSNYYGWIKIDVPSGTGYGTQILGYAYQDNGSKVYAGEGDVSLPVELVAYTAVCKNNAVKLDWSTESEKDNVGFILERRLAGELDWDKIASHVTEERLRGNGTTSEKHDYFFIDTNVNIGATYEYRLSDVDINGTVDIKKTVAVTIESTPANFLLHQNYPNPFNPNTTIEFELAETQNINLSVFNMAGQLVKILIDEELNAGNHSTEWNAANASAGTYFYQLKAGSHKEIKKAVLIK